MRTSQLDKIKSLIYVCSGAATVFSVKCYLQGHEGLYDNIILPFFHYLSPELSHNVALKALKNGLVPKAKYLDPPMLKTKIWGRTFSNPVGIAAGFDKDGEAIDSLHKLGFGFVEIGSVTPKPQPGNPKPRLFRLSENEAIINRYGFNSAGHKVVFEKVRDFKRTYEASENHHIVGVNLGKNKSSPTPVQDYVEGIRIFGPVADYLVINVSSPNTPGLRDWQMKDRLEVLLKGVIEERNSLPTRPPLLLKLSPDLSPQECMDITSVILNPKCRVDGLIISNTSSDKSFELAGPHKEEEGGLSGRPIFRASTSLTARMYSLTNGQVPIIGVGGVFSGRDAYEKIKAGASLVQLYSSFIYHGPPRIIRIKEELQQLLEADGHSSVAEAVGKDVQHEPKNASNS